MKMGIANIEAFVTMWWRPWCLEKEPVFLAV